MPHEPHVGGCDYDAACRVFFCHGQRIGRHLAGLVHAFVRQLCARHIVPCLPAQPYGTGQNSLRSQTAFQRLLHGLPYGFQKGPYGFAFITGHIFPVGYALIFAQGHYRSQIRVRVDALLLPAGFVFSHDGAAAHAVHFPAAGYVAVAVLRFKQHAVGMPGHAFFRFPDYFTALFAQCGCNGPVGQVAFACGCQTFIQGHAEPCGFGVLLRKKTCGVLRSHGVAGRRAGADAVKLCYAVHMPSRL